MVEASGSRPRPKPRPRPRLPVSEPKQPLEPVSTGPIEIPSSPPEQKQTEADDEDALFMRNRSRTAKTWKKLKELDREASRRSASSPGSDDDDYSSPRRKNKKTATEPIKPAWAKKGAIRLLSEDLDDDEVIEIEDEPSKELSDNRKRERSRSKSITPPPALHGYLVQHARDTVRQILDPAPRTPSPPLLPDDTDDSLTLDPELARIAASVRGQPSQTQTITESFSGGPEVVTIKVRWRPHPLDQSGQSQVWGFKIKRHDPFRVIFEEIADLADILFDNLIICHDQKRIFPSITPNSLKIWADVELEACNVITYNYLRTQRHESPAALADDDERTPSGSHASPPADPATESDGEPTGGDTFKLTLRSAVTTITLTVRPTTTCGAIIKAFLKSAGLEDKHANTSRKKKSAGPRLQIDGESLNPADPISKADLEDGDCVDVVGL